MKSALLRPAASHRNLPTLRAFARHHRHGLIIAARYGLLMIAVTAALTPIYAAVVTSLTPFERLGNRQIFPVDWHWKNYLLVWSRIPLARYLLNSLIYSSVAALAATASATLSGYALSRMYFWGKRSFVYLLLLTQVIPLIVLAMPLFRLSLELGVFDSYAGVTVALVGISLAYPTFLMRSYFDSFPREIEEAASVDGCSRRQALWRVVLPSSGPGLLTSFALVFFNTWQQFLLPMILTESRERVPVTVGVFRLTGDHVTPWELVMAASLIACIPPMLVYLLAQRFLEKGLTAGAVK
jgi:ABC-type glycerol-3-phosphate transport system permease component